MSESNNYYNEVKEALEYLSNNIKGVPQEIMPTNVREMLESGNLLFNFDSIMEQIGFEGKHDGFTAEQKEHFAIANRDLFDPLISMSQEMIAFLNRYNEKETRYLETLDKLNRILGSVSLRTLKCSPVEDDWEGYKPLLLTNEEFYWALSFLNEDQVRAVLSEQKPYIFDKLLKSYNTGKSSFIQTLEAVDRLPERSLRPYLVYEIEKVFPQRNFLDSNNESLGYLMPVALDEYMMGMDEAELERYNAVFNSDKEPDIDDVIGLSTMRLDFMDMRVHKIAYDLYNYDDLTYIEKQDVKRIYGDWLKLYPDSTQFDKAPKLNDSIKFQVATLSAIDQWILAAIHRKMAKESKPISKGEEESMSECTKSTDCRRLDFPTRMLQKPNSVYSNYHAAIFEEIYKIYGGQFENMSLEEWLYFWGASNVRPDKYSTPYYWAGDEGTMKALLRIFYVRQPRLVRKILLYAPDRVNGVVDHDWGRNKDSVAFNDVQEIIHRIVKDISGITLPSLPQKIK